MAGVTTTSATTLRTHRCGELRAEHVGNTVRLGGWVHRRRDLGGLVFIDLRDRAGMVQVSFGPDMPDALTTAARLTPETVVLVRGTVAARPAGQANPDMPTGEIEVRATQVEVAGPALTPAIPVARGKGEELASEELRLRHRHLDLRRPELIANLTLRHRLTQRTRLELSARGFLEIETPILTRPTPEGARDYLVPSRVHPGEFYALPQSPQLYKQLLMVSGYDRYFQVARCFRDEDLRADRQPEFTQIDIEAAFVQTEDILELAQALVAALWDEGGQGAPEVFPRLTYAEAMERYGSDRPDLRYGLELRDVSAAFAAGSFSIARSALEAGGRVRGLVIPGGAALSRREVDELEAVARGAGAAGLIRLKGVEGGIEGPAAKFLPPDGAATLAIAAGALGLFVAGPDSVSSPALDRVRQEVARRQGMIDDTRREFLLVTDFPMFAEVPGGGLTAMHHPFTAPHPGDMAAQPDAPARWRALAYDVVLNGTELGGGSIRTHDPAVQQRVLALLGITDPAEQERRFGFLLDGLRAGAPPHGGIAFGLDRICMLLAGADSLRDVIAYPKTTQARALFEDSPTAVPAEDLAALHLEVTE